MIDYSSLLEYGMGVIALIMMYSITYNHLSHIEDLLEDIKNILSKA
ncbi:unnamed protein product [marine sediment metagenome]|uniref:YvrJ family protein n=1 Tax=marine sediment metagenome TaxID=412755 RepID=X1GWL8_9ZZZZ